MLCVTPWLRLRLRRRPHMCEQIRKLADDKRNRYFFTIFGI
jgi:hypothetical protein